MWAFKGALLGFWLAGFGTMAWLYFGIFRHMPPNSAVGVRIITSATIQSPLWWIALVVCIVLGCAITRSWSGPLGLWIALLVTGLIPAGLLALFVVLVYKLRHVN